MKFPPQKLVAFRNGIVLLSVRLFVCLSPATHTAAGGGGLLHQPFWPNCLVFFLEWAKQTSK